MKSFLLSLFFILSSSLSYGHEVRPSYLELIQETQTDYRVLWKVPAKGNNLRLGLKVVFSDDVTLLTKPHEYFTSDSYVKQWRISDKKSLTNRIVKIDGLQSTFTEVLVRVKHLDGSLQVSRLLPDKPFVKILASPKALDVALSYTGLGVKHILLGVDHLLFLVCLLIISGSIRRILITITGFTLAHSITLVLSTLGVVHLAIAPVEAIIALSIVFVATEIAKGKRDSLTWKYPVSVSSSFGLLHGFGFAAVLNEIGLPQTEMATGLLFFNVGVEIGQIIFVVSVITLLKIVMKVRINIQQAVLQRSLVYFIGSMASFWLIQRSIASF